MEKEIISGLIEQGIANRMLVDSIGGNLKVVAEAHNGFVKSTTKNFKRMSIAIILTNVSLLMLCNENAKLKKQIANIKNSKEKEKEE